MDKYMHPQLRGQFERMERELAILKELEMGLVGIERRVNRGKVNWLGNSFHHDKLQKLNGKKVVIVPSRHLPRTKIKVYSGNVKICTIYLTNLI